MHKLKYQSSEKTYATYIHTYIISILLSSLLSGCGASLFADRATNPSIQDVALTPEWYSWADVGLNTFTTKASHRMVLVNFVEANKDDPNAYDKFISCAEPPPDVAETFASAVSDTLKAEATEPKSGVKGALSNDYAKAITTQIAPLIYRTQSLQLYRDAIHNLCIARMNGWYPKNEKQDELATKEIPTSFGKAIQNQNDLINLKNKVDVNDYNVLNFYYFEKTVEALKYELPLVLKALEEFSKNQKNTGIPIGTVKELVSTTKTESPKK